jgi:hypothetical protein
VAGQWFVLAVTFKAQTRPPQLAARDAARLEHADWPAFWTRSQPGLSAQAAAHERVPRGRARRHRRVGEHGDRLRVARVLGLAASTACA